MLYVPHDTVDGGWRFLDGQAPDLADAIVVEWGVMLAFDPSIADLTDLPFGWTASRKTARSD